VSEKSRHFKLHRQHGQVCIIALDSFGKAHSRWKKLSTIFVDNTVDRLYKEKVSGVGKSIFCSAIKKYAPRFSYLIQWLAFEGRVVVRSQRCSHVRFVTIVDEEWRLARVVKSRKQTESARKISCQAGRGAKYAPVGQLRNDPVRIECGA
jgi:hypothetical protein